MFRDAADEIGADYRQLKKLHDVFSVVEEIEIHSLGEGNFQIILDKKMALYFYKQTGEKYKYDGFETGDYN